MTERQKMLQQICGYDFALLDTALYLDSHPQSKAALDFYAQNQALLQESQAAYEEEFGPLTKYGYLQEDSWSWIQDPWPWEGDAD